MIKINNNIIKRVYEESNYIIDTNKTVRQISKEFNISKSTVHKDLTSRIKELDNKIYDQIKKILDLHFKEKHIHGGEATKNKYSKKTEINTKY